MEFHALEEVMLMVLEEEWMKLHTLEAALEVVVEEAVKVPLQYPLQKDYDQEGMGKELSSLYLAQKMGVEVPVTMVHGGNDNGGHGSGN